VLYLTQFLTYFTTVVFLTCMSYSRWIEFTKKSVAKRVANLLNGEQIGVFSILYCMCFILSLIPLLLVFT
jgi:hypothetical protein